MAFKFEILIFGQQIKMDIHNFEFIYFPTMDEFYLFYLIQITNEIHPCKNDIHAYEIIHI
jgi:asparagine N-glycosylation enzyme membrane subunit Stt3